MSSEMGNRKRGEWLAILSAALTGDEPEVKVSKTVTKRKRKDGSVLVSETYRITIPKSIAERLGIKDGDTLVIITDPELGIIGYIKKEVYERLLNLRREKGVAALRELLLGGV